MSPGGASLGVAVIVALAWAASLLVGDSTVVGVLLHGLRPWWGLLPALGLLLARRPVLWAAHAVLLAGGVWPWLQRPPTDTGDLLVASANLYHGNDQLGALLDELAAASPDVIVLIECGSACRELLNRPPWTGWPYAADAPRDDPFGLAVRSRFPLTDVSLLTGEVPWVRATLTLPVGPVTLWAVHAIPPYRADWIPAWRDGLARIAQGDAHLVIGDLNATSAHPAFARLAEAGFGHATSPWTATWPNHLLLPRLMQLDHVLVRDPLRVSGVRLGPGRGSDHRSVFVTLRTSPPGG